MKLLGRNIEDSFRSKLQRAGEWIASAGAWCFFMGMFLALACVLTSMEE
jgi:hypothetical protein